MNKFRYLVTDLDDTLFKWFDQWHSSHEYLFRALWNATKHKGIEYKRILGEVKTIHKRVQTSEYSFLIDELPFLKEVFPGQDPRSVFSSELKEFSRIRRENLALFPTVRESLNKLKDRKIKIVGYTESMEYHTVDRLRTLNLDGVLDVLYSRDDHASPEYIEKEKLRTRGAEAYELEFTSHERLDISHRKPDPKILNMMVKAIPADPAEVVYIGDSGSKDIMMANDANIFSVRADLGGKNILGDRYDLLKLVTHWTPSEVELEHSSEPKPDLIIQRFDQILELFHD